jgi:hypothetical protein
MSTRVSLSSIAALCVLALAVVAPSGHANANVLPLGGTVAPDVFSIDYNTGYTAVADTGLQAFSFAGGVDTGSVVQFVLKNNTTGFLDFVTEFNVTAGVVQDLSVANFTNAGYSATYPDVGYNSLQCISGLTGCPGTFVAPTGVNATGDGSVIEFTFGSTGVTAGELSNELVVQTNATTFSPGTIGLIDGGGATANGYEPAPAPLIGHGLSVVLAVGGMLFGVRLWARGKKGQSLAAA